MADVRDMSRLGFNQTLTGQLIGGTSLTCAASEGLGTMNAVHIATNLDNPAAGTTYYVLRLTDALARSGLRNQIHALRPLPESVAADGYIIGYPVFPAMRRLGISPAMRRGLSATSADVLHSHAMWMMPNVYAGTVARTRRIPLVFSPHGMFTEWALAFHRWRKQFAWWCLGQRRAAQEAACFHATTVSEAEDIRRLGFRQPIAVVPCGVDLPDLGPGVLSLPRSERQRVLFLSRIHPKKGIPILLRAWQRVEHRYPKWELVVAGPDERGHLSEVRALASGLALIRVSFPGPVFGAAKDALYRSADLFVLPTHSENFGMVIAEALTYGVPVITTTGSPWQELETRDCGWWLELSEANLAEALRTAMDLPDDRRRQMGRRGRRWMEESYGWPRIAEDMKAVYEWALGGRPKPGCVLSG